MSLGSIEADAPQLAKTFVSCAREQQAELAAFQSTPIIIEAERRRSVAPGKLVTMMRIGPFSACARRGDAVPRIILRPELLTSSQRGRIHGVAGAGSVIEKPS